jgi:hypothetical protein
LLRAIILIVALRAVISYNSACHRYIVRTSFALLLLASGFGFVAAF